MLKLPRFRGPGSLKPKNDGPLICGTSCRLSSRRIRGTSSETGAAVRGAAGISGRVEVEGDWSTDDAGEEIVDDRGTVCA